MERIDKRPCGTQACFDRLVRSDQLDRQSPNVALHTSSNSSCGRSRGLNNDTHCINQLQSMGLLCNHLSQILNNGISAFSISPFQHGGARSVLFKVTLLAYGDNFVSERTVRAFAKHSKARGHRVQTIKAAARHVCGSVSWQRRPSYDRRDVLLRPPCLCDPHDVSLVEWRVRQRHNYGRRQTKVTKGATR